MAKKMRVRDQDKFMLRLPNGLRDRIKAYADRYDRSMNSEIVRVLEREFPEPWGLDKRIEDLLAGLHHIRKLGNPGLLVDKMLEDVRETLEGVVAGRMRGVDEATRQQVQRALDKWKEDQYLADQDKFAMSLDEEEVEAIERTGRPEKFADRGVRPKTLGEMTDEEIEADRAELVRDVKYKR